MYVGVPLTLSVSDPRLREAGRARAAELREWLSQRYEDAVAAAAVNNTSIGELSVIRIYQTLTFKITSIDSLMFKT